MLNVILDDLEEAFNAAGVLATRDPARVRTPGVWLALNSLDGYRLDGSMDVLIDVILIVADTDIPRAIERLSILLEDVMPVVGGMIVSSDLGTTATLPDGSVCPAFRLTISTQGAQ